MWNVAKFLRNRVREIPPLKSENVTFVAPLEKAQALADKFEQFHNNPLSNEIPGFTSSVKSTVNIVLNSVLDTSAIDYPNAEKIDQYIRKLKINKAPGPDCVPNILLKRLPYQGLKYLTLLITDQRLLKIELFS